jgi:hypothetical protein
VVLPDEEGRRGRREGRAIAPPECGAHWRKRRRPITDPQHWYRAGTLNPRGARPVANFCGSTRFLTVDDRDGNESNDWPSNLRWLCRSCNTRLGLAMTKTGQGRRTRQSNRGSRNVGRVRSTCRATPKEKRLCRRDLEVRRSSQWKTEAAPLGARPIPKKTPSR